jgi:glutamine synthetase
MLIKTRQENVTAATWSANGDALGRVDLTEAENNPFGADVFSLAVQKEVLDKDVYEKLQRTLDHGEPLDLSLADAVAEAMKEWALARGATHFTHVFQPLTGLTAEKHDSFFEPDREGRWLSKFSGKELIQGEPDASSFPTGGIRETFEARGYTAWDPTSPAFILENPNGALLCIPTAFVSWTGEALDAKTPLLRSMDALSKSAIRALKLLGDDDAKRVFTTVGPEQEYFLIDENYFYARPDLVTTGRTLFGAKPAKGHELDDHYFGATPERVLACIMDFENELAKLGVPVKTRHNEVAPAQHEIAPIFENSNVGSDHQQLTMRIMQQVARKYGLVCLLHEKPFAGVNGSGKHNNWSMGTDTGVNLLDPGDTPHENINFLFFCAAVIQAVNKHQGLLRASVADIGQDHRLGANEAPPAIISIFLGAELEKAFDAIASGEGDPHTPGSFLDLGAEVLPPLPMHGGDRNRTSPFAFTGNKFEFRAVGSSASLAFPNTVLNTIVAEAIDELADKLEAIGTDDVAEAVTEVVKESYLANKPIIFDGDNYDEAWHKEAEERGLKNLRTTPDALPEILSSPTVELFGNYHVLSERELSSRFEVWVEQYIIKANIEAETADSIARTMILPAALRYLALGDDAGIGAVTEEATPLVDELVATIKELDEANVYPDGAEGLDLAIYARDNQVAAMAKVREAADKLEKIIPDDVLGDALYPLVGRAVEQLVDRGFHRLGEPVGVRQRILGGIETEAGFVPDGRHPDRDRVVISDRDHRIGGLQLTPAHVHGLAQARDVGDGEVEGSGARDLAREDVLNRSGQVPDRGQGGVGAIGIPGLLALAHLHPDVLKPPDRIRLVAGKVDEHERDPVAELAFPSFATDVHGDHRLQRSGLPASFAQELPHPSRRHRQEDVVDRAAKRPPDSLQVAERAAEPGQVAGGGDRLVQGHRRLGWTQPVSQRPLGPAGPLRQLNEPAR